VPRFTGHAEPHVKGHEIKKDISILFSIFNFSGEEVRVPLSANGSFCGIPTLKSSLREFKRTEIH